MSTALNLRQARKSDQRALSSIRWEAIVELAAHEMGREAAREWAGSAKDGRVLRAIERGEVWVTEVDSIPSGWIEIGGNRVEGLYVHPDAAGSGIGSSLMRHAEVLIRSGGYRAVELDASPNAENFYLRRGYKPEGERSADDGLPMLKRFGPGA